MPQVRYAVSLPEGTWLGDVTSAHPAAVVRIHATALVDGTVYTLASITAEDPVALVGAIEDAPETLDVTEHHCAAGTVLVGVETADSQPLAAGLTELPTRPSVVVQDSVAHVEPGVDSSDLPDVTAQLEQVGTSVSVDPGRDESDLDRLLSDRQQEVVRAALDHGYYDASDGCTLTELADRLSIAKSTCSELLQRAERAIVSEVVEESSDTPASPPSRARPLPTGPTRRLPDTAVTDLFDAEATPCDTGGVCDPDTVLDVLATESLLTLFQHMNVPKTTLELAEESGLSESTAYRGVTRLEDAGLVERVGDEGCSEDSPAMYQRSVEGIMACVQETLTVACLE